MDIRIEEKVTLATYNKDKFQYKEPDIFTLPEFKYLDSVTKRYALMYTTGTGVAEDPHTDRGFICECNNERELMHFANKLHITFNSEESILSSWAWHHFKVIEN